MIVYSFTDHIGHKYYIKHVFDGFWAMVAPGGDISKARRLPGIRPTDTLASAVDALTRFKCKLELIHQKNEADNAGT